VLANQYTIKLPADYDMDIIRDRVRHNGSRFDVWPGLAFKAFLISERARGATANRYAPFYVWHDITGANEFLYGDGFAALEGSFGRPRIEHWITLDVQTSTEAGPARSATRQDVIVPEDDHLAEVRERAREWLQRSRSDPRRVHTALVALDPYRWQLVRFALWCAPLAQLEPGPQTTQYELLHLSAPGSPRPLSATSADPRSGSSPWVSSARPKRGVSSSLDLERAPTRKLVL